MKMVAFNMGEVDRLIKPLAQTQQRVPHIVRLAALAILMAGCSSRSSPSLRSTRADDTMFSVPRCYRVDIGPWSETGQPIGLVPPAEFRLDTTVSARQGPANGSRSVYPAFATERISRFPGEWSRYAKDSLRIHWSTGFQAGGYRLQLRGDSVKGIATTWTDDRTGDPDPEARATGIRIPCRT